MKLSRTQVQSKDEKEYHWSRHCFYISILSAVFGAFYLANDTFIMHNVIVYPADTFTAVAFYLITGGWIGFLCMLVYASTIGRRLIDKNYTGLTFGTRKMQLLALVSGTISAGSTAFCLIGNQALDPSLVIALSAASVVYLAIYDFCKKRTDIKSIIVPILLVAVGSFFSSVTNLSGGFVITWFGILIMIVGRCGTDALENVVSQEGGNHTDSLNFVLWRFFWLALSGTVIMLLIAFARGKIDELIEMRYVFIPALPWILLTMFLVFFSLSLRQKAMENNTAVSKINLVLNFKTALGIPIALCINAVYPGIFGNLPLDLYVWVIRALGVSLIIWGVIKLRK